MLYRIAAALPLMKQQGSGHFASLSSVAGHRVVPTAAVYSETKYAVRAISEGLRQEVRRSIRATIISSRATESELAESIGDPEMNRQVTQYRKSVIPADAIARAIAFAIGQPHDVGVNEILMRPTAQDYSVVHPGCCRMNH